MELPRDEDKELITDFIINWSNESDDGMSMSSNTKTAYVSALVYLARHHNHKKSFKEMSPEDFFSKEIIIDEKTGKEKKKGFLENIKRKFEDDIEQKWVNTYNNSGTKCLAFWKW